MRGSPGSEDRGVADMLPFAAPSSERWRARARYALLGTALVTSPILLPFALALLMLVLRGTPLGAAILERLHLVYIGSVVCCLAALATACLTCRPVQVPDRQHLELQRWLVAHGRHTEDVPTAHSEAPSNSRPISLAENREAPRDAAPGG
jgi:hypothetical protein